MEWNPSQWDWELMVYLNNLSPNALDEFWTFITYAKHWIPLYAFIVLLFFYRSHIKKSFLGIFSLLLTVGFTHFVTELTKFFIARQRPNTTPELSYLLKVLYEPNNYSFFSGHASTSFSTTVFVYIVLKTKFKALGLLFIWPVLFSLSRIFVGVHFPSDIIVGGFVGSMIGIAGAEIYRYIQPNLLRVSDQNNAQDR